MVIDDGDKRMKGEKEKKKKKRWRSKITFQTIRPTPSQ
jgi:hypothetical protein